MKKYIGILLVVCPLFLSAQKHLVKGHYFDLDSNKVEGSFKMTGDFSEAQSDFNFYNTNGEKIKVKPENVLSVVIGMDSFAVIKNFSAGGLTYFDAAFALVYYTGAINIYKHKRKVVRLKGTQEFSYPTYEIRTAFVINAEGSNKYNFVTNIIQFKEKFLPLIKDNQGLVNKILDMKKKLWIENLPTFVKEYNAG